MKAEEKKIESLYKKVLYTEAECYWIWNNLFTRQEGAASGHYLGNRGHPWQPLGCASLCMHGACYGVSCGRHSANAYGAERVNGRMNTGKALLFSLERVDYCEG